jgi:hypothetical protein
MANIITDSSSIPVTSFTNSWFFEKGFDRRFTSKEYMSFFPVNSYAESSLIKFVLPKWLNGNVYDLSNAYIDCRLALKKTRDSFPNAAVDNVAPVRKKFLPLSVL